MAPVAKEAFRQEEGLPRHSRIRGDIPPHHEKGSLHPALHTNPGSPFAAMGDYPRLCDHACVSTDLARAPVCPDNPR
jgi:hypothetical protein